MTKTHIHLDYIYKTVYFINVDRIELDYKKYQKLTLIVNMIDENDKIKIKEINAFDGIITIADSKNFRIELDDTYNLDLFIQNNKEILKEYVTYENKFTSYK